MMFRNEYNYLSNMYLTDIKVGNIIYPSVENAFQAMKCADVNDRSKFVNISPVEAKKLGRKINMRPDWDKIKVDVMYVLVKNKFLNNNTIKNKLCSLDCDIQEDNSWNDTFWGVCNGVGSNYLGKILMKVRDELK